MVTFALFKKKLQNFFQNVLWYHFDVVTLQREKINILIQNICVYQNKAVTLQRECRQADNYPKRRYLTTGM